LELATVANLQYSEMAFKFI